MDEADFAQANQAAFDRRALALQLAAMPQGESAEECEECGARSRRSAARRPQVVPAACGVKNCLS